MTLRAQAVETDALATRAALNHWKADLDLVGVRRPDALARLSESEQSDWRRLWEDVNTLLEQAEGNRSK